MAATPIKSRPASSWRDGSDLPITVLNGKPGLHQLSGRPQLLAAGQGAEGGHRPARRRQLQARLPRRRGRGPAPERGGPENLLRGARRGAASPIACAYIRARGADRLCSYGDWAALSDVCDAMFKPNIFSKSSTGAANDISIFKILKNNRKQLYRLVLVSTAEIHVIINDSPFFTSFIQQFFHLITQLRRYSIIRADHHNVIPMYFRHCHIQPQPWIIFIKKIFSIILFIQKS